jgi:hypothetical protein
MEGHLLYGQPHAERPADWPVAPDHPPGATPALFQYAATPNPVPCTDDPRYPSRVTLMIAVANVSGKDQDCAQIVFTLPTEGAGALTPRPDAISVSPAQGTRRR